MTGLPPVSQRSLRAAWDRALAEVPDEVAHIGPEGRYTFAEAHRRCAAVGGGVLGLGVPWQAPVATTALSCTSGCEAAGILLRRGDR